MPYRRTDMLTDAQARGWDMKDWFRVAGIHRWNGYDFMRGKSNSEKVAAALTHALGRRPGYYLVRRRNGASA